MIAFAPDILPHRAVRNNKAEKAAGYMSLIAIKNQSNIVTEPVGNVPGGDGMESAEMTDKQFDRILKMISMILEGCKDLEEAKRKVAELAD